MVFVKVRSGQIYEYYSVSISLLRTALLVGFAAAYFRFNFFPCSKVCKEFSLKVL
jgi:hypothetical protein